MVTIVIIYAPWAGLLKVLATSQSDKLRGPNKFRCRVLPLRARTQSCRPAHRREERLDPKCACLPTSSFLLLISASCKDLCVCSFSFSFLIFSDRNRKLKIRKKKKTGLLFYKRLLYRFSATDLHWRKSCALFLGAHYYEFTITATLSSFSFSHVFQRLI